MSVEYGPTSWNRTKRLHETLTEVTAATTLAATIQVLRETCEMLDHGISRNEIAKKLQGLIFEAQAALSTQRLAKPIDQNQTGLRMVICDEKNT